MNKDSLKAKARNMAQKYKLDSKYIIKNVMFGFNQRSTMDMDATLKGMNLTKDNVQSIIENIISIDIKDGIRYEIFSIKEMRLDKKYPGFKVHLLAYLDDLRTHLLIDLTTGDIITLKEIDYEYNTIFGDETINIETIIAEKFEAIISRSVVNSRMKDYYDLYMFTTTKWNNINKKILVKAINNTCNCRDTIESLKDSSYYINLIKEDENLKKLWSDYQSKNEYAKNITFEDTIDAINKINDLLLESE